MNLKIKNWYGRLGNNIEQVKNAIQIALYYNYNVILPSHRFFNSTYLIFNPSISKEAKCLFGEDNYFRNKDEKVKDQNINKTINELKKLFIIKNINPLNKDECVIHIRSGDIFSTCIHPKYIQPPFDYYRRIIENNKFNKIYIISKCKNNPVIEKLLNYNKNIIFKVQDVEDDIKLLLGSSTVVESYSTFTSSLLVLSNNIEKVFRPNYQTDSIIYDRIILDETDLSDYKNKIGKWKNNNKQRELLLNYRME
jgi:hypothetical protein